MVQQLQIAQFVATCGIKTRPNAGPGLWLMFLVPLSLILSAARHPLVTTPTYKLSSILALGTISVSLLFLYQASRNLKLTPFRPWLLTGGLTAAALFYFCLHRGILFSLWSGFFATIFYYKLYLILLDKLPNCFTLGEAAICAQGFTLLLYFTSVNIFENFRRTPTSDMQISTITIQIGLLAVFMTAYLSYRFRIERPPKFYATALFVFGVSIFLFLHVLIGRSPLVWIFNLMLSDFFASKIVLYWGLCSILAVAAVRKQISGARRATTATRKTFHILAVVVYIPGLLNNCSFLYLASGVVLGIFFVLELLRVLDMPPLGQSLQDGRVVYGDEKDTGIIALTPIYLLAGCSLPLWLHPAPCDVTNSAMFNLLPLLSGILTIGIGDTAASIVGSNFGRHRFKGSTKTIEGTIACFLSQAFTIFALDHLGFLRFSVTEQYIRVVVALIVTSLVEAKTDQVDNLVLPLIMYIILI